MNTVILAGGSGFLGRSLAGSLLRRGYRAVILSRSGAPVRVPGAELVQWDAETVGPWRERLEGATAVVNLVGKSVNCRYTPENRREILESRLRSVRILGDAIARCERPPGVLVQAASLAIYGDAGDRICTEEAPAANGFSSEVCTQWEAAANSLALPATRTVILRIGFVLGRDVGALQPLSVIVRRFLGGPAGRGDQYVSWIHEDDLNEMFRCSIENGSLSGVFNATGPSPVTNREFMRELRTALHRPWAPPTPSLAVRIGAWLMKTEASLILTGRRAVPKRFLETGFRFRHPQLGTALAELLG